MGDNIPPGTTPASTGDAAATSTPDNEPTGNETATSDDTGAPSTTTNTGTNAATAAAIAAEAGIPISQIPLTGPGTVERHEVLIRPTTGTWTADDRHIRDPNPRIDINRMGGEHAWETLPVFELNFHHFVVNGGGARRPDMQRWFAFYQRHGTVITLNLWSQFTNRAIVFRIPTTVPFVDRTFARDQQEAYYVDDMARALGDENRGTINNIRDVVLFNNRDGIIGRWWNGFHTRPGFLQEANLRATEGIFAPHDSIEVGVQELDRLRELYPSDFYWYDPSYFPNHVPVPTPPSVYYFNTLFRTGDLATRV